MNVSRIQELAPDHKKDLKDFFDREWWSSDRSPQEIETMLASTPVVIAYRDNDTGRLAGFARAITDGVFKALILDVIVAPELRGKGLGKKIMQDLLAHPLVAASRHKELYCKPEMEAYYRQMGFGEAEGIKFMKREG